MSALARRVSGLKAAKSKVFRPAGLDGDVPEGWLRAKKPVAVDGNQFLEIDTHSDDPLVLLRYSRLYYVREEQIKEAREAQLAMLDKMEKEEQIKRVPEKWQKYVDDLRKGSSKKAEAEYNRMSRWKVRTDELKPERDVFVRDYLWLSHAMRQKTCVLEQYARDYFPLPCVIAGIRKLATQLLNISDPPTDPDWYLSLCPWFHPSQVVKGYPHCLSPSQAWQLFRAAGYQLALGQKEEHPNALLTAARLWGRIFEMFAADPTYMETYTNHWSRVELLPNAARHTLSKKHLALLARGHRNFPAFRAQQAWWYAQPDRLRTDALEDGIYFYQVPSIRHTLQAGVPALQNAVAECAAAMLWQHFVDDGLDLKTNEVFENFAMAVSEVEGSTEAIDKVMQEFRGVDTPLLASADLTKTAPTFPNRFYNETYRPIMRYEVDHAAAEGLDLPAWYLRRRKEIAQGPHSKLVPDLRTTVAGEELDFSEDFDPEAEEEAAEAAAEAEREAKRAKAEEEGEDAADVDDENVEYREAFEDESIPAPERLRLAQLRRAQLTQNAGLVNQTMMQEEDASALEYAQHDPAVREKVKEKAERMKAARAEREREDQERYGA
eukprot:TRINITY_DN7797_c0_g3_i1.p1 TRINITY_DN7797_c0_g3~~TRINITY_DN7797_c0_g3_i1.p1  ORF type:complete len:626 (+),score=294.93 TRINITY_DN7797_c0_g3_i1:61-1878(+)